MQDGSTDTTLMRKQVYCNRTEDEIKSLESENYYGNVAHITTCEKE